MSDIYDKLDQFIKDYCFNNKIKKIKIKAALKNDSKI